MADRTLKLKRFLSNSHGTFGTLSIMAPGKEEFLCFTLEPPWRHNVRRQSCIPIGIYPAHMSESPRFKKRLYELSKVNGRSEILIHSGNYAGDPLEGFRTDSEGCIILGTEIRRMGMPAQLGVANSTQMLFDFHLRMRGEPFELWVSSA